MSDRVSKSAVIGVRQVRTTPMFLKRLRNFVVSIAVNAHMAGFFTRQYSSCRQRCCIVLVISFRPNVSRTKYMSPVTALLWQLMNSDVRFEFLDSIKHYLTHLIYAMLYPYPAMPCININNTKKNAYELNKMPIVRA